MKKHPKQAFTLIELLTVIAIIGILASILIPTVGRVRESARRTVDANNIRQIGQASLIYANDNRDQLPPRNLNAQLQPEGTGNTTDLERFAGALALSGGLNDAQMWFSGSDSAVPSHEASTVLTPPTTTPRTVHAKFQEVSHKSFRVITGLSAGHASTTPIAFTRGLNPAGQWVADRALSVYGSDGGHITFIGGNTAFFKNLGTNAAQGRLIHVKTGERTNNIQETVTSAQSFRGRGPGPFETGDGI